MIYEEKDQQFYRDTEALAFPKLDDRQLALLEPFGKRRTMRRGEVIFKAGQRDGAEQILGTGHERDFICHGRTNRSCVL